MRLNGRFPSSWIRNRVTPELRDAIRDAGEGEVRFGLPNIGRHGWVFCEVIVPGSKVTATAADPTTAFAKALRELHPVEIRSVLRG